MDRSLAIGAMVIIIAAWVAQITIHLEIPAMVQMAAAGLLGVALDWVGARVRPAALLRPTIVRADAAE